MKPDSNPSLNPTEALVELIERLLLLNKDVKIDA